MRASRAVAVVACTGLLTACASSESGTADGLGTACLEYADVPVLTVRLP